jgi:hypothetical protein
VRRRPLSAAELPEVPLPLRRFDAWTVTPPDSPAAYLAEHGRWLEARRVWEAASGTTVEQVWERLNQLHGDSLEAIGELYGSDLFIQDETPDPRWST